MWFLWLIALPLLCAFGVVVLVLGAIFGTLHLWPVLLVALGLWLLFRGGRRDHLSHWERAGVREPPPPRRHPHPPRRGDLSQRERSGELPIDLQVKVEQIRRKVDVLLAYADRFPPLSHELYLVRQTANDYLPRTINAYLSLPKEARDRPVTADGRTARQELQAQLDLLDKKLDEIAQDLQRQDADRLLSNRRFLEDRFAPKPGAA